MIDTVRAPVRVLSPAVRARTSVASCGYVRWEYDGATVDLPFAEQAGSLILIVGDEQRHDLLTAGEGAVSVLVPGIAGVRLAGTFWPVVGKAAEEVRATLRACHEHCEDCPARQASLLVGLQVERVDVRLDGEPYVGVDLDAYVLADPDWLLAQGVQVTAHVNAAHPVDVLEAAAIWTGQPAAEILSAQLEWTDGAGIDVSVVDGSGGLWLRRDFAEPVLHPGLLCAAVHAALASAR